MTLRSERLFRECGISHDQSYPRCGLTNTCWRRMKAPRVPSVGLRHVQSRGVRARSMACNAMSAEATTSTEQSTETISQSLLGVLNIADATQKTVLHLTTLRQYGCLRWQRTRWLVRCLAKGRRLRLLRYGSSQDRLVFRGGVSRTRVSQYD